eukprot:COSAG03_NODE_1418_length_4106_cov_12.520339_2_plen_170_part_00
MPWKHGSKKAANLGGGIRKKCSAEKKKDDYKLAKAVSVMINKCLYGLTVVGGRAIFYTEQAGVRTYYWLPRMEAKFWPLYQRQNPGKFPPGTTRKVSSGRRVYDRVSVEGILQRVDESKFTEDELLEMQNRMPVEYNGGGRCRGVQTVGADPRGDKKREELSRKYNNRD